MEDEVKGFGYPPAVQFEVPYQHPPKQQNPILKGTALSLAARLVTSFNFVARFFYANTQVAQQLGKVKEYRAEIPTYNPTVIPNRHGDLKALVSPTDLSAYRPPKTKRARGERFSCVLDYHEAFKTGGTTPTAVAETLLPLIRRDVPSPTKHSVAFISCKPDLVLAAAAASTERWKAGTPLGILDGVPIAMKDDIALKGHATTLGTNFDFVTTAEETSWCIQKWIDEGAVIIGKCNMQEMGMGTNNNNPSQGTPLNPYNEQYYTGGSTGGGAHAVAAGLVLFVQGSDAGGSLRVPSNYCGLYGLKPTHNRVSIRPTVNGVASTCVFGPLAANMADLEVAFRVMAAPDPLDPISRRFAAPMRASDARPKILGIFQEWFDKADQPVKERCQKAVDYLRNEKGYQVVPITLPHVHEAQLAHAMTVLAEAVSTFGAQMHRFGPTNRILMSVSKQTPASDFLAAQKVRTIMMKHLAYLFEKHPGLIIVTPTTPNAGWPIGPGEVGGGVSNENFTIRNMAYIWLANFCGLPSLQFPAGYVEPEKGQGEGDIPVGLMGTGEWGRDDDLIEFGFDGEDFLMEEGGGRRMPPVGNWVDVLQLALNQNADNAAEKVSGTSTE